MNNPDEIYDLDRELDLYNHIKNTFLFEFEQF